jgi:hypothetical protein
MSQLRFIMKIYFVINISILILYCKYYSLRPKISDVFDFLISCLIIRLIQLFCTNYKINKSLLIIFNDKISHNKIDIIYTKILNKTNGQT